MSHFKKVCEICKKVITQCRCLSKNKEIIYEICDECKNKPVDMLTGLPPEPGKSHGRVDSIAGAQKYFAERFEQFKVGHELLKAQAERIERYNNDLVNILQSVRSMSEEEFQEFMAQVIE